MVTITVKHGKHAQELKDEALWVVTCDDRNVARRLSVMLAEDKQFRRVMPQAGGTVSFATPKRGYKHYKKALEGLATSANIGEKVTVIYSK